MRCEAYQLLILSQHKVSSAAPIDSKLLLIAQKFSAICVPEHLNEAPYTARNRLLEGHVALCDVSAFETSLWNSPSPSGLDESSFN